jgi:isocitrate dehydrogenase
MYWAQALADQSEDSDLASQFKPLADTLAENEEKIVDELNSVQGEAVDIGGYFRPDLEKVTAAMRPSQTLNEALESVASKA